MAKILKTTKDKLVELLNATDQVPSAKLASDIGKHLGFRKALKKHLKDYTDQKAASIDKFREEQRKAQDKLKPIEDKLKAFDKETLTNEENDKKLQLEKERDQINTDFQAKVNKINEGLSKLADDLKIQKVEVTFDNEEFLFEKNIITDNATEIFKNGEKFNADAAEIIFDLFDSVQ